MEDSYEMESSEMDGSTVALHQPESRNSYRRKGGDTIKKLSQNTSIFLPLLDRELHDACESQNVESVRRLIKIGASETDIESSDQIPEIKKYYLFVDFLLNNLENTHHESLLSLIKESLTGSSVKYEEASCLFLIKAVKKGYSNIIDNLMKCKQYFDIDAKDSTGNTALHYAVQENGTLYHMLVKTLIKNGASMNVKNNQGIRAIDRIHPNTIEDILDECVEESNSSNDRRNENYELKMNFSPFSHGESLGNKNESEFITTLDNSESHRHFLYHPLVALFLHIKWQKVKFIWYLNILFNIIFYLLIVLFMCLSWNDLLTITNTIILRIVITLFGLILLAREIAQMKFFKWNYLLSFDNHLELTIIFLTFIMLYIKVIPYQYASEYKKSISAWLIVFITVEFLLLVEKMHLLKWSLYISMFRKITFNFMKLTVILFSMVLAFGISFYLLIRITPDDIEDKRGNNQTIIEAKEKNEQIIKEDKGEKFADSLVKGILKTIVMATGEFEYSSLDFKEYPAASLLFAMFIFAIFLVAMNLLNGIAITDIQIVQNQASNYHVKDQVECVINFDKIRPMYGWFLKLFSLRNFDISKFGPIFRRCFPDKFVIIKPNIYYLTTQVICKGHDQIWYTNRFVFHFTRLIDFISFGTCGDIENLCQGCRENVPKDKHECKYKHHYHITPKLVALVREIKEQGELEDERSKIEEDRKRMIRIEKNQKILLDMHKHTNKSNGTYGRRLSF